MEAPVSTLPPAQMSHILAEAITRITTRFQPLQIVLFGSWARGTARPDSDMDLLVVLPSIENKRRTLVAILRALNGLPTSKDVLVTTPEEIARRGHLVGDALHPALREGKVVYERARS